MKLPFRQKRKAGLLIREFSKDVDSSELVWHRDRLDRHVKVLEGDGWRYQSENNLPIQLTKGDTFFIPKNTYHRVIKGNSDLVIEVREMPMKITKRQLRRIIKEEAARLIAEEEDQNKDGKNDFSDVKIARMKASGMSDEEIKKKHPELFEADGKHPKEYSPKEKSIRGMTRGEAFDKTQEDLASGDPEREARAWRRRKAMEDYANENTIRMPESHIRTLIHSVLKEELSKSVEAKIRKIAKERGMTFGSMKAEYKKGLAAWGTSGAKSGASQHAWATARIKKANPSDDWSVVKKSKARD